MSASHIAPQNKPQEVAGVLFAVSTSWGAVQVLGKAGASSSRG